MEVTLSPWQNKVWSDNHRFKVIAAGRRSGKSTLAQLQVITWANEKPGLYWIIAPTYRQAKEIHWRGIQEFIPQALVANKNETELSMELVNGARISLKGAENPDTLRGVKLRGLVIDEIASIRNWDWLWQEVLRPTLTDYQAPAIFISTPKGFNHFYDLYQSGQNTDSDYSSWRFTSYDNPYIPKQEIDAAKLELTEDTFMQEYMADFRKFTGLAHKEWDRRIHYIDEFDVPSEWHRGRGFDYGSAHYTASPKIAIDNDDNWFVERSYLDGARKIEEHANAILAEDFNQSVLSYGDPSGKQWFLEFSQHNLHIQPANKEIGQNSKGWVEYGVEKINERLKPIQGHTVKLPNGETINNAPKLFVLKHPTNENFVKQIENMKWKETAMGDVLGTLDETGDPTGGHYDLMAAMRYFAVSYNKPAPLIYRAPKNWVIG